MYTCSKGLIKKRFHLQLHSATSKIYPSPLPCIYSTSTYSPYIHTHSLCQNSPHADTLNSEEVLQVLGTGHVAAGNDLSLVVGHSTGVGSTAVDEGRVHLELWERPAHPVCIQHRETKLRPQDQRLKRVCPSNFGTEEVSDPLRLERVKK